MYIVQHYKKLVEDRKMNGIIIINRNPDLILGRGNIFHNKFFYSYMITRREDG